jgi:RNA polymerase sigma-70 factor, ECF subfamily
MTAHAALREMHAEGSRKWPSISVTLEQYQQHCERSCAPEAPSERLRDHAADLYLCCACALGDTVAQCIFQREAEQVVRGAIVRVHRETEFVRETVQEFWKKLLAGPNAKVNDYRGNGPLQAWLRVAAARLALDRRRAERVVEGRETDLSDYLTEQAFGPESRLTRDRYHAPFGEALACALDQLTSKERILLRMHVVGRCSIDQIGRAYGVHRATAARWLEQAKGQILKAVRAELALAGPALTDSEFQSVARVVGGELELEIPMVPTEVSLQDSTSTR